MRDRACVLMDKFEKLHKQGMKTSVKFAFFPKITTLGKRVLWLQEYSETVDKNGNVVHISGLPYSGKSY